MKRFIVSLLLGLLSLWGSTRFSTPKPATHRLAPQVYQDSVQCLPLAIQTNKP
ncbi:MAG: hypothetical protein AAF206_25875 [Bacteroidota bacterium]